MTAICSYSGGSDSILIHTSVKLVTDNLRSNCRTFCILIHTSVKLVTEIGNEIKGVLRILIHTSVKLVTYAIL